MKPVNFKSGAINRFRCSSYPMLRHLRIDRVRLLTNNPAKVEALARDGISVIERINPPPVPVPVMVYAVRPGNFPVRIS